MSKTHITLFLIIIIAALFRLYNLDWDQKHYFHPDERAIIMKTIPLQLPNSLNEFFSPQSPLNPHFFAYGNFPLYLLKTASIIAKTANPMLETYGGIHLVGRFISVLADLGTIFFIFLIGSIIFNKNIGMLSSLLYSLSVFPIQASHFYAVDVLLTFFIVLTLYQLLHFYKNPSKINSMLVGIFFGLSLVTKISAIPLVVAITMAIVVDFILIFAFNPHKPHIWLPHVPKLIRRLIIDGALIILFTFITFAILQPYALISFDEFWRQNLQQAQMTKSAFTFPYTLQYVGIIPYWYQLKNVFLWGLGPILAIFSFLGFLYFVFILKDHSNNSRTKKIILLTFFIVYFGIVGQFAVGWMRYMLPLYPLFALFSGLFIFQMISWIKQKISFPMFTIYCLVLTVIVLVWPLSFMYIYTKPNTRVQATDWIIKNIPTGKSLAIEHWEDSLPLSGQEQYTMITFPLYDPDTPAKWIRINDQIASTDYIILASNRLYTPLQKLTNCEKLPPEHCYPLTAEYYKKLFSGRLGFTQVADFENPPTIPILNIKINDQNADESFTVYDHPKVMIFKKNAL